MWMFFVLAFLASMIQKLEDYPSIELTFRIVCGLFATMLAFAFIVLLGGCGV
jgi:hypothetical protein